MKNIKFLLLAGALALASIAGVAYAGGLYTNGFPVAGTVPNTLPLTGNELIPADTQLANGLSPQTEAISVSQLAAANRADAAYSANSATGSATATAAQLVGSGSGIAGYVVLDLTGTISGAANLTTPTAALLIAAMPNVQNGSSYVVRIISETASNTWTLVGGTGVTVTGTATVTAGAFTDWVVTVGVTAGTVTFQRAGSGTK